MAYKREKVSQNMEEKDEGTYIKDTDDETRIPSAEAKARTTGTSKA